MKKTLISLLFAVMAFSGMQAAQIQQDKMTNQTMANGDVKVLLNTSLGDITILLYGDTPGHRDNFIKRVENGDYDGVLFHRVINDFMIQTGDPESKNAPKGKMLGSGDSGTQIAAEILFPTHYHHRGAIAAARTGDSVNPEKKSSGSQFYIVTGKKFTPGRTDQMERRAVMQHKQDVFNGLVAQHRDSIMAMRRNRDTAGLQALQEQLAQETERLTAADSTYYTPEMREAYINEGAHRISTVPTPCMAVFSRAWMLWRRLRKPRPTVMTVRSRISASSRPRC